MNKFSKPIMDNKERARRPCMVCGKLFDSMSRGCRICHTCETKAAERKQREALSYSEWQHNEFMQWFEETFDIEYLERAVLMVKSHTEKRKQINDRMSREVQGRGPAFIQYSHCDRPTAVNYASGKGEPVEVRRKQAPKPTRLELTDKEKLVSLRTDIYEALKESVGIRNDKELVDALCSTAKISVSCAKDSVSCLPKGAVTREGAQKLAAMVAGNIKRLRNGEALKPWHLGDPHEEWAFVEVTGAQDKEVFLNSGEPAFALGFRVLTGAAAGSSFVHTFKSGYERLITRAAGIPKAEVLRSPYIVGMRIHALLCAREEDTALSPRRWYATSAQQKFNKALLAARKKPCPKMGVKCVDCVCGHSPKTPAQAQLYCRLAVRPLPLA